MGVDIRQIMDDCGWNKAEAARRLGISERTLRRRLLAAGLGARKGATSDEVVAYLYGCGGIIDYGEAATSLFGSDTRATRQRVYTVITRLLSTGRIVRLQGESVFQVIE